MQELEHYLSKSHDARQSVKPAELSLEAIRVMLASFFGVKEPSKEPETERKIKKMAKASITKDEKDAWIEAGMPSPFNTWLASYRQGAKQ